MTGQGRRDTTAKLRRITWRRGSLRFSRIHAPAAHGHAPTVSKLATRLPGSASSCASAECEYLVEPFRKRADEAVAIIRSHESRARYRNLNRLNMETSRAVVTQCDERNSFRQRAARRRSRSSQMQCRYRELNLQ
jgi:hypothetical protein